MRRSKSVYKTGDCLINKTTRQVYEIINVCVSEDGIKMYTVKKLNYPTNYHTLYNHSILQEYFEFSPAARLLYTNNK